MIQRKTQTAEYWQRFTLTPDDIQHLHDLMLDSEQPQGIAELAEEVVKERCRREEADLRAELSRGKIFQPKNHYQVGDKVIFPALEFRLGDVIEVRPGQNPEYGAFDVISVDFGPDRRQRSFAAGLSAPHKLNADTPDLLVTGELASPRVLQATVASGVRDVLGKQLSASTAFASLQDRWLPRDFLAEIHVGHLNIAEALIEVRGEPLDTGTLIKEMDLPVEIKPEIQTFSLESALLADGRFDQVGPGESHRWYLRRFEPPEALQMPPLLVYTPIGYDRTALPAELRQLEWELDDEWSDESEETVAASRAALTTTTLLLTYPHLASGTLPLNNRSRPFFPGGHGERTMVTLIDGRWGQRFTGWAVRSGRYIAGLKGWFEQHKLVAGAFITLERRDQSGEVVVDFRPKRMRREWTRRGLVEGDHLDIQLRKQEVACEYDEQAIIGDDKFEDMLKLRTNSVYASARLEDLVFEIFTDLAGLSQTGTVYAKTIYSAVNLLRRCPPGPVFAALSADVCLVNVGGGQFRLAE